MKSSIQEAARRTDEDVVAAAVQGEAGHAAGSADELAHQLLLDQVVHTHMVLARHKEKRLHMLDTTA